MSKQPKSCPLYIVERFTEIEHDVFETLCRKGYERKMIGRALSLCESTVHASVRAIKRKINVDYDYQIIIYYYTRYIPKLWKEGKRMEAELAREQRDQALKTQQPIRQLSLLEGV